MKPSTELRLKLVQAALSGVSAQPHAGVESASDVARDAWAIADATVEALPYRVREELDKADALWEGSHGA